MSEAIRIDQVNAQLLTRVCADLERMSDADLDALCLMIEAEMTAIEAKTFRPLREIQLGIDDGTAAALLADYQAQIGTLREQRATLVAKLPGGTL